MVLDELRQLMTAHNLDAYIVVTSDPHNSEYLAEYYKERAYLTGFSGSQGTAVVTQDEAYLWADGRYFEQAEREIQNTGFQLQKIAVEGYPTVKEYLDSLKAARIGFNALYMPISQYKELTKGLDSTFVDIDLFKTLWTDRALPKTTSFSHKEYSVVTSAEKLTQVRSKMTSLGATALLISSLEDISYLTNSRGGDISRVPVTFAYVLLTSDESMLFIDSDKIRDFRSELEENFTILPYESIFEVLEQISEERFVLADHVNTRLYQLIEAHNSVVDHTNIVGMMKCIKNQNELSHMKASHLRDGAYVTEFMYYLKTQAMEGETEWTLSERLDKLRATDPKYYDLSFETISAYGPHGSMMHYKADEKTAAPVEKKGFLLVDSGGQYMDGTTDITRTFAMGPLTEEEKYHFTYVLKSHFNLMNAVFPKGTTSKTIDGIARSVVWQIMEEYRCGTGHGVGYMLGVHETPPNLNQKNDMVLEPGMVLSNEPGIYKDGRHGIRTENLMTVVEHGTSDYGTFYGFENLTFVPYDVDAIDVSLLTDKELETLNSYHHEVYDKISPLVSDKVRTWLYDATKPLERQ
ncbi:aminopeptidase P family protein [Peptoniphilus equinus]|uniref:Aminopeptidase P family protein n=1 Tax=Peptoniphilus equinus TaxID=3016343 RepID=A0ABY7QWB9_9FIRM|nr:aminopeptidase P family protein [Peptoniphilus equinus]WBW50726.1 aminopeptidase P family protein [Peptoniphilus equinus]